MLADGLPDAKCPRVVHRGQALRRNESVITIVRILNEHSRYGPYRERIWAE
ncbi:MAG: hypothetical protein AMXMBFR84_47540 [Candidatus Hydrogenedentota bacterium]